MANLSITAANVGLTDESAEVQPVIAGSAATQGQLGYLDAATGQYKLCDADAEASSKCEILFLTPASAAGDQVLALFRGKVRIGATMTARDFYTVSATAGAIAAKGDVATSGQYEKVVGQATTTGILDFQPGNFPSIVIP